MFGNIVLEGALNSSALSEDICRVMVQHLVLYRHYSEQPLNLNTGVSQAECATTVDVECRIAAALGSAENGECRPIL